MTAPIHRGRCYCNPNETHGSACPILAEFRQTPDERMAAYRDEFKRRQTELAGEAAVDVPYRLQQLGVPQDAIMAVRNPRETSALDGARRFLGAQRDLLRTLILGGPHGVGKSVAAAFVLAHAVRHHDWNSQPGGGRANAPFVWAHAAELTQQTDFGRVSPDWLEGLRRCAVLVLDDVGKDATAPGVTALTDLLTYRHEKRRATVVTSNLDVDALKERYGLAWYERVKVASLVPNLAAEKSLRKKP